MNSQVSGLLILTSHLLSHCFLCSEGHPWPSASQCPAGSLLNTKNCFLQRPPCLPMFLTSSCKWNTHCIQVKGVVRKQMVAAVWIYARQPAQAYWERGFLSIATRLSEEHSAIVTAVRQQCLMAELFCPLPGLLLRGKKVCVTGMSQHSHCLFLLKYHHYRIVHTATGKSNCSKFDCQVSLISVHLIAVL